MNKTQIGITIAGILVLIIVVGVVLVLPYRPVIQEGNSPDGMLIEDMPQVNNRIHVFNTGWARMSWFLVGDNRPWRGVPSYVIEHPTEGLIVFDPGMPSDVVVQGADAFGAPLNFLMEARAQPQSLLINQMREANLNPEDVNYVIISHQHPDHFGELEEFINATYISGPGSETLPDQWGLEERWQVADFTASFSTGMFDTATQFVDDGSILLLGGGGHTAEDIMLLLSLESGLALLAGDAVVHRDWLNSEDVQRIPADPERAADVRNQVRYFLDNQPGALVFYGHDLVPEYCTHSSITCYQEWYSFSGDNP